MKKKFFWVFVCSLLVALAYHHFFRAEDTILVKEREVCASILPKGLQISGKDSDGLYRGYDAKDEKKIPVGFVFSSRDVAHDVYGYADKIDVVVGLSNTGIIQGVEILRHQETPGFFKKIEESRFVERFHRKKLHRPLVANKDIDTVTGATVSSNAILETINAAGGYYVTEVLKLPDAQFPQTEKKNLLLTQIQKEWRTLILLASILLLGFVAYRSASEPLWLLEAALTAYFLGFHSRSFLSILNILSGTFISYRVITRDMVILSLFGIFALLGLIIPRFFCGYVCPFGGLMRLIQSVSSRNQRLPFAFNHIKYYILSGVLVVFAITLNQKYVDIEPFIVLFNQVFSLYNVVFIVFFITMSFFLVHFWCNYFCPLGALGGILALFSLKKKKIIAGCVECGQCLKVCPHNAIQKHENEIVIHASECFSCQECVRKCPKNAIKN